MRHKHTPPPPLSEKRPYGRQAACKTIKAVSIDADLAQWLDEDARGRGMSASALVNGLLSKLRVLERGRAQKGVAA